MNNRDAITHRRPRIAIRAAIVAAIVAAASVASVGSAAAASPDPVVRPIRGACATSFVQQPSGLILISGTCTLAHLGLASYEAVQVIIPNPDGTVAITVTGFYTAANGDRLTSSIAGTGHFTGPTSVAYSTVETWTGGTGRFAAATGTMNDEGTATFTGPTTGVSTYTTSGTIAY